MPDDPLTPHSFSDVEHRARSRELRIDGEYWCVYEHLASLLPIPRWALVFESESVIRRVYDYPTDWRELPDAELYAVSWKR